MEEYVIELPICRVCLQSAVECIEMDTLMLTNEIGEESQTYFDCFKSCTNLDVSFADGLPRHICASCSVELQTAYDFITKAKNSHDLLLMQAEDIKPEYLLNEFDSQTNEFSEETVFLPMENVEEIFEEETDGFGDLDFKEESIEIEKHEEEKKLKEVEDISTANESDGDGVNNIFEEHFEDEERIEEFHIERNVKPGEPGDRIICNLCEVTFLNIDEFQKHGESVHSDSPFCCMTCFRRFKSKKVLVRHMKRQHDGSFVTCNICGNSVKKTFLRTHKKQAHSRAPFLCSACPRTFKSTTGLQIHSETHKENRERNFECEKCHKKFLTERTFKVHARVHWQREHFKCSLCDKQFLQKVNLRLHMQMHRGETMPCLYCDKKFVRKTDLSVHMRFHTGNFPYECKYCDRRFAIVSHLNYHQKRHQGVMYKCNMCEKEFMNMSGLRNHSFQHTAMPFNCAVCDKGFPTRFKIKRHLKAVHHVEDEEQLERFITTENIKLELEPSVGEEVLLEEVDEDDVFDT